MVRLVFRPHTQLRGSICTSEPLRTSTRVSSGFALAKYSSPSFGSHQLCSYSNPSENRQDRSIVHSKKSPDLFTFITRKGFPPKHSHRQQTPWSVFQDGWLEIITPTNQVSTSCMNRGYNTDKLLHSTAFTQETKLPLARWKGSTRPQEDVEPKLPILISSPSTLTISRTISLSFRSAFHLSFTVLVRYRSLVHIQLYMVFTTHFELHSQTTRLLESPLYAPSNMPHGIVTLHDVFFQRT